ncbi:hypothetical protein NEHOM01_1048 [Nematocida homosporus]|uniref:uncharacterized protein n=1 Tax=Nematocida homosporus TaxID=1912981 RepID=UPI00222046A5|nr:uncharacterized protein NEHOM01_1048 [Nematocida homosporus]KAI5185771.1 hypothetical protein NEHOM01_1048 [Nematocida homosporus]
MVTSSGKQELLNKAIKKISREYEEWDKDKELKKVQRKLNVKGYTVEQVYYQIKKVTDWVIDRTETYLAMEMGDISDVSDDVSDEESIDDVGDVGDEESDVGDEESIGEESKSIGEESGDEMNDEEVSNEVGDDEEVSNEEVSNEVEEEESTSSYNEEQENMSSESYDSEGKAMLTNYLENGESMDEGESEDEFLQETTGRKILKRLDG